MRRGTLRLLVPLAAAAVAAGFAATTHASQQDDGSTATPIKHVVVIFQENVSFDHYFATYPIATNPAGEPAFDAKPDTPSVNGLNESLLAPNNPNSVQPFRLDRSQFETSDQDHSYTDEQKAFDGGLMDKFVESVGRGSGPNGEPGGQVMGYYDGNTVTAMWNYAQNFAMSDNSFSSTFGPSTPGALNLVSGNTTPYDPSHVIGDVSGDVDQTAVIGDPDPYYDDCGSPEQLALTGKNVGDLLNAKGVTWGWFQGGFKPTTPSVGGSVAQCHDGRVPHQYPSTTPTVVV